MALLDLQGMETPATELAHHGGHGSSASKHSCPSNLSVAACGGGSGLSLLLCQQTESGVEPAA